VYNTDDVISESIHVRSKEWPNSPVFCSFFVTVHHYFDTLGNVYQMMSSLSKYPALSVLKDYPRYTFGGPPLEFGGVEDVALPVSTPENCFLLHLNLVVIYYY